MSGFQNWLEYLNDRQELIQELTIEHAILVIQVMVAAIALSVLLGILVHRVEVLSNIALSITSIFITIPSLALFTLFIPIVGIGKRPAQIALFMYALLPILRNTVTGLNGVNPAVEESAKGMGMSSTQRLLKVKLPLAWPVILTGIRVSTLLITGIAAIATLVGAGGLGDLIQAGFSRLGLPGAYEPLWTGVIFTVLLALTFDLMYLVLRRFTTPSGIR
ncbi:MAG: ABC transporter permease [Iamia sp.]